MKIQICIGSSCHLRGSEELVKRFQELAREYGIAPEIELAGSFCMGACSKGVSVRIANDGIYHVKPEDAGDFFKEVVMERMKADESN